MAEASDVPARIPRAPTNTKIGDLPEEILLRVLSHLTTREAVHTCLLAHYWRHLWRSVPCINVSIEEFEGKERMDVSEGEDDEKFEGEGDEEFEGEGDEEFGGEGDEEFDAEGDFEPMDVEFQGEDDDYVGPEDDDDDDDFEPIDVSMEKFEGKVEEEVAFKRFVNHFLMLRSPVTLDEFRLRYSCRNDLPSSFKDANLWIAHASEFNARAVQVVNRFYALELSPAAFVSRRLNRLHISSATLVPGFFNQLQMGCPALEYMFLHDTVIMDLDIFSSTLKVLVLSSEIRFSYDDQASISAPSLVSLSMDHGLMGARLPILSNMPSLKTASVSLSEVDSCDADGIRQFLGGLSHATSLDFCYSDRKLTVDKSFRWCPTFTKLINLTLDCWCVDEDLYALIVFLQNSPNLKRLTLQLGKSAGSAISGELEDRSFTCEQLEIVEIIYWNPSEMLPRVTQFFHASGVRPDQMRISCRNQV